MIADMQQKLETAESLAASLAGVGGPPDMERYRGMWLCVGVATCEGRGVWLHGRVQGCGYT